MKSTKRKTVTARLNYAMTDQINALKEASDRPISHLVISALSEYLEKAKYRCGSVISGTQRRQDLIPAFAAHLYIVDEAAAEEVLREFFQDEQDPLRSLWECARGCSKWPEDNDPVWELMDLHYLEINLSDALAEEALDGMYFGAHPGDGSDYGYWPEGA